MIVSRENIEKGREVLRHSELLRSDELCHYGRKGMKWYQHIFGDLDSRAKYFKGKIKEKFTGKKYYPDIDYKPKKENLPPFKNEREGTEALKRRLEEEYSVFNEPGNLTNDGFKNTITGTMQEMATGGWDKKKKGYDHDKIAKSFLRYYNEDNKIFYEAEKEQAKMEKQYKEDAEKYQGIFDKFSKEGEERWRSFYSSRWKESMNDISEDLLMERFRVFRSDPIESSERSKEDKYRKEWRDIQRRYQKPMDEYRDKRDKLIEKYSGEFAKELGYPNNKEVRDLLRTDFYYTVKWINYPEDFVK